jgi:hypothetical protein
MVVLGTQAASQIPRIGLSNSTIRPCNEILLPKAVRHRIHSSQNWQCLCRSEEGSPGLAMSVDARRSSAMASSRVRIVPSTVMVCKTPSLLLQSVKLPS